MVIPIMTPEQLQQFGTSPMALWFSMVPWWMKLIMLIQLASYLACAICLPLITWKLWRNNSLAKAATKIIKMPPEILERQARRDVVRKMAESPQSAIEPSPPDAAVELDNSKYLPPE